MLARRFFLATVLVTSTSLPALAADWPQWRGPERTGISRETGLAKQWPAEGPKLLWQIKEAGFGYSTPSVVGDRLYLLGNKGNDDEFVLALSVADGKEIWRAKIGAVGRNLGPQYPGARSTPTIDGEWLYAIGSDGDLACLELSGGKELWHKNLRSDFGGKPGAWAYSESPLVDGDVLVCTPGGADATIVALNKKDGETIWKSAVPGGDRAGYASVIAIDAVGYRQYVQFLAEGLVGVDAKSGKFLWRYEKTAAGSPANIPTPVAENGLIYSATSRGGGGLVELKAGAEGIEANEVYFSPKLPNAIGGSVLVDGYLYGAGSQGISCVKFATGEVMWQERGIGVGAVCYAEGRLYLHSENDDVALIEATPEAYRELGKFTLPEQPDRGRSKAWAYPVVANGRLYLRDLDILWCYDVKDAGATNSSSKKP